MYQFKTWTNNLENEATKAKETSIVIQKVEYRNADRIEKSINTINYVTTRKVTKDFYKRKEAKVFGIGNGFDDLKTNASISTVQRENVWAPYYEVNLVELDFKEKMIQAAAEKKAAGVDGQEIMDLKKQLQTYDENSRLADQEKKDIAMGIKPKKALNTNSILAKLKARDAEEDDKPVIDPVTVKIRQLNNEIVERDLQDLLQQFGEIVRVKIPMDEERGTNKGIGFVTFKMASSATAAVDEGYVKFEYYELPVERATQSKARMEQRSQGGGRGGFGDGERRGGYGDRGGRGGGDRGGRGGYGGDRDGGGGGYDAARDNRRPEDTGFLKRRTD